VTPNRNQWKVFANTTMNFQTSSVNRLLAYQKRTIFHRIIHWLLFTLIYHHYLVRSHRQFLTVNFTRCDVHTFTLYFFPLTLSPVYFSRLNTISLRLSVSCLHKWRRSENVCNISYIVCWNQLDAGFFLYLSQMTSLVCTVFLRTFGYSLKIPVSYLHAVWCLLWRA
jgi:hypothetical protein